MSKGSRRLERRPLGFVALVLHAHLPFVRHPEHERSLEERWLFEAMWESYLPLVEMLDRLADEGIDAPFSLSVSPPLAAMLRDAMLVDRFVDHVRRTRALAERTLAHRPRLVPVELDLAIAHHAALLDRAEATFERHDRDVLGALAAHHERGTIHLFTTTATHAFLPGLVAAPSDPLPWALAQIELGQRVFNAMTGIAPKGLWLPECAFSPPIDDLLARTFALFTVLDAHGIALAEPRPSVATLGEGPSRLVIPTTPLLSPAGRAYFGRDLWAGRSVWAMDGYPSHPEYREHHRDLGFDLAESDLLGEIGPDGRRIATGIKPYRITGAERKAPYDPAVGALVAREHAEAFVRDRASLFEALPRSAAPPLSVAPFDAELFGHFWHEGPLFLEHLLRGLTGASKRGGPAAISLLEYSERFPARDRAMPATSTWGEGGFGATWTGRRTASLWRHIHHVSRDVRRAVIEFTKSSIGEPEDSPGKAVREQALDRAIIEALLLQSSDFAFMIHEGTTVQYALERTAEHAARAGRFARIALAREVSPQDAEDVRAARNRTPIFSELSSDTLRRRLAEC